MFQHKKALSSSLKPTNNPHKTIFHSIVKAVFAVGSGQNPATRSDIGTFVTNKVPHQAAIPFKNGLRQLDVKV